MTGTRGVGSAFFAATVGVAVGAGVDAVGCAVTAAVAAIGGVGLTAALGAVGALSTGAVEAIAAVGVTSIDALDAGERSPTQPTMPSKAAVSAPMPTPRRPISGFTGVTAGSDSPNDSASRGRSEPPDDAVAIAGARPDVFAPASPIACSIAAATSTMLA